LFWVNKKEKIMNTSKKVSTFRLIYGLVAVLLLAPCVVGAKHVSAKRTSAGVVTAMTSTANMTSGAGFVLYPNGGLEGCYYNQNHVFDFAGDVIGNRSSSNPTAVLDANGNTIAWLLVPASD
jgi:hypothetical protein